MSRFRFISEHRAVFGVKRLCRVLKVSRSGFYAWLAGIPKRAGRVADDNRLLEQIQACCCVRGNRLRAARLPA